MSRTKKSQLTGKMAFVGTGRMATALAEGFVAAEMLAPADIVGSDPSPAAREAFAQKVAGASLLDDNAAALRDAGVVVLAVKPQVATGVLNACRGSIRPDTLVISIAAGVPIAKLSEALPDGARIVRVMPNTPCLIGRGASGYSLGPHASSADAALVGGLMGAVGYAVQVDEALLDAVTGVSGSGPAFVYTVVEALADAGVRAGLPRPVALELAARTAAGAAEMITATGEHPATLRDAVTSPGGTTAAGLAQLEQHRLPWALHAAVAAAAERSKELSSS